MIVVITGGAGFIGSNFVRHLLKNPSFEVRNMDALTYAGNLGNLSDIAASPRYSFLRADISQPEAVEECLSGSDAVVHLAAETHVDRSLLTVSPFIETNVVGTHVLLEACRRNGVSRFIQVSTDEVYGSIAEGLFTEISPLSPNSPYSASKASADLLVHAYHKSFGLETCITRCSNNYGPFQFPEKFVPLMILTAIEDRKLPIYGDGRQVRDWIHVEDHCRALEKVLMEGRPGQVYNIGGGQRWRNLEVARRILRILDKSDDLISFVRDRPAHDRRYAIDYSFIRRELDWEPQIPFEEGLEDTVRWYRENLEWVRRIQSGDYAQYYERNYEQRDKTLENL